MNRILAALLALCLTASVVSAADLNQSSWSETDTSNTSAPPAGWPSSMFPSDVRLSAQAMMGAIKRFYDHIGATATSAGTANAQTLTYTVAPAALVAGDTYSFIVGAGLTNTGPTTLNINALGAKAVQIDGVALEGLEMTAGQPATVTYDGTNFQLSGVPTATTIHLTAAGTAKGLACTAAATPCGNLTDAINATGLLHPRKTPIIISIDDNGTFTAGYVQASNDSYSTTAAGQFRLIEILGPGTLVNAGSSPTFGATMGSRFYLKNLTIKAGEAGAQMLNSDIHSFVQIDGVTLDYNGFAITSGLNASLYGIVQIAGSGVTFNVNGGSATYANEMEEAGIIEDVGAPITCNASAQPGGTFFEVLNGTLITSSGATFVNCPNTGIGIATFGNSAWSGNGVKVPGDHYKIDSASTLADAGTVALANATLGTCTGGTMLGGSSNYSGRVQFSGGSTSCVVNFALPTGMTSWFGSQPSCNANNGSTVTTSTTTSFTMTNANFGSLIVQYTCQPYNGG